MQFELPRRHRKSFEVSTKKKLNTKFNKTESLEIFETIKKEYSTSPVTFGSSSGKKEALLELLIITASQIAAEYKDCDEPIDVNCNNKVSQNYSRAYLNHLHRTNEMLGAMLATYHNISYYQSLMNNIRSAIKDNLFAKFIKDFYNKRNLDMPDGPI